MRSPAIYIAIKQSIPVTKDGHGSRHKNKCNVHSCVMNCGKETHNIGYGDFNKQVKARYEEITKERLA